jgi:hypothetical protein
VAGAVAIAGAVLFTAGWGGVATHYADYRIMAAWIPPTDLPVTPEEMEQRGAALAARYPNDPRAHMHAAVALVRAHDDAAAERELQRALRLAERSRPVVGMQFENTVRAMLAAVLLDEGQRSRAREFAQLACLAPPAEQPPAPLLKGLADARLCQ